MLRTVFTRRWRINRGSHLATASQATAAIICLLWPCCPNWIEFYNERRTEKAAIWLLYWKTGFWIAPNWLWRNIVTMQGKTQWLATAQSDWSAWMWKTGSWSNQLWNFASSLLNAFCVIFAKWMRLHTKVRSALSTNWNMKRSRSVASRPACIFQTKHFLVIYWWVIIYSLPFEHHYNLLILREWERLMCVGLQEKIRNTS